MPTINFPTGPTLNDEYSFGGKTWKYNGTAWELISTGITSTIRLHANAAFDAANTADQKGTSAGSYANGAFAKANTANTLAQAAFDAANAAAGVFAQALMQLIKLLTLLHHMQMELFLQPTPQIRKP